MLSSQAMHLIHRHVDFTFEKVEAVWLSDTIKTQFMHGLSLFIPTSERIVIEIMRHQLTSHNPNKNYLLISDLIKQEGQHAAMHRRANQKILQYHPELNLVIQLQTKFMTLIQKVSSSPFELAIPVAFEHFTAAISKDVLTHQDYWFKQRSNENKSAVDFLFWHCLEEFEHQSVCHTIYKSQYKDRWRIIFSLLILWLPVTMISIFIIQFYLLIKDKTLLKPKNWLPYISFTVRTSRLFLKGVFKYSKKAHKVWDEKNKILYENARHEFSLRNI